MKSGKRSRSGLALPITAALLAAPAVGQVDGLDIASVPLDLPGHDTAPRSREAQTEAADEPVPPAADGVGSEASEAPADDPVAESEWPGGLPWWRWSRATGDWGGLRPWIENAGFTAEGSYTFEWSSVWDGGLQRSASTRSLLDVNLTLDLEQIAGWQGATVFVDFYSTDGRGGSAHAGDFQGYTNLETEKNVDQVSEVWLEQVALDGAVRLKAGKIEANSEFAFVNAAGEFVGSSAGFSPTIIALPSYPDPATGVVLQALPVERLSISGGVFDGSATVDGVSTGSFGPAPFFSDDKSDDYFFIGEAGIGWSIAEELDGRVAAGVWHHTGDFETFQGSGQDGTTGWYALAEQRVLRRTPSREDGGLWVFGQFGWSDEDVSEARLHAGLGASLLGILAGRDDDAAGVYVSWVDLSGPAGFEDNETSLEVFYRLQVTPWGSVKPALVYIANPGGDPSVDDAVVGVLRFEVAF